MSYLGTLLLLGLLILIHEAGHFAAARLAGIPVAGFAVGFGPRVWSRRRGGTEYSLRAFPLGGFVVPAVEGVENFRATPLGRLPSRGPPANRVSGITDPRCDPRWFGPVARSLTTNQITARPTMT